MSKEEIEELAFKDRKELANLNELDLLEIIEFLQLDRKQWINQYSTAHNDYVNLQQENQELKLEISGYRQAILKDKEMLGLKEQNQKYKEVIDKIMNLIKQYGKYDGKKCTRGFQMWSADFNKILDILKEVE